MYGQDSMVRQVPERSLADEGVKMPDSVDMSDARILAQIDYSREQVSELHSMISRFEDIIGTVLVPTMDGEGATPGPDRRGASVLSNLIDDLNGTITHATNRLAQLANRVQL